METYILTAKTFAGLEEVLAKELETIGAQNVKHGKRAVYFNGDKQVLYKSNFYCRTALRILKQLTRFRIDSADELYEKAMQYDWSNHLDAHSTFVIKSTVNGKLFKNSMFASLRLKDAIADFFRKKTGERPSVDPDNPDIIINLHISENRCTISLDSSGESLHKRGYKTDQNEAPLSEVLAAGMILLSGWSGDTDFIDPMCGSGTIPIEAALIATNIPPGIFRQKFAFEKWKDFDNQLLIDISEEYVEKPLKCKIYASDILDRNINIAKQNAKNAFVHQLIEFNVSDFAQLNVATHNGTLMMNPPYGERLKPETIMATYQMIGERLKHQYHGHSAWILSYTNECFNQIGLKPSRKIKLFNGALPCQFRNYELYQGSKKHNQ